MALKNVSYNITVKSDDWLSKIGIGKQRYQAIKSGVSVAPNAALPIPINLHDQPVKAGKYQISGTVQVNGQRWHIATDGTVSAESAKTANAQDPNLIHDYTITYLGIAALVILIIVISIIMFGRNKHKKKTAATKKKLNLQPRNKKVVRKLSKVSRISKIVNKTRKISYHFSRYISKFIWKIPEFIKISFKSWNIFA